MQTAKNNFETAPPIKPNVECMKSYRPQNLPWTAERKGTDNLVWYTIFDSNGDEMCGTGSDLLENERGMLAQVFLILTSVNQADTVSIDGKEIKVEWR